MENRILKQVFNAVAKLRGGFTGRKPIEGELSLDLVYVMLGDIEAAIKERPEPWESFVGSMAGADEGDGAASLHDVAEYSHLSVEDVETLRLRGLVE